MYMEELETKNLHISIHVKIPVKLYHKLWEYAKNTTPGNPLGAYSRIIREALKVYLEQRGVKIDE